MGKGIVVAMLIVLGLILMPFLGIIFLAISPILLLVLPLVIPIVIIGVLCGYAASKKEKKP
jgi:hypothetical protein